MMHDIASQPGPHSERRAPAPLFTLLLSLHPHKCISTRTLCNYDNQPTIDSFLILRKLMILKITLYFWFITQFPRCPRSIALCVTQWPNWARIMWRSLERDLEVKVPIFLANLNFHLRTISLEMFSETPRLVLGAGNNSKRHEWQQ